MNTETLENMMEISRLKKKLMKSLVSEKTMRHLDVIRDELKEMALDILLEKKSDNKVTEEKSTSKAKKVIIE